MSEEHVSNLSKGLTNFIGRMTRKINHGIIQLFTKEGRVEDTVIKVWCGKVRSTSGIWEADISSAGFNQILHIEPVALSVATDFNLQVSAILGSYNVNKITGRVVQGSTSVIISNNLGAGVDTEVLIKVTGI